MVKWPRLHNNLQQRLDSLQECSLIIYGIAAYKHERSVAQMHDNILPRHRHIIHFSRSDEICCAAVGTHAILHRHHLDAVPSDFQIVRPRRLSHTRSRRLRYKSHDAEERHYQTSRYRYKIQPARVDIDADCKKNQQWQSHDPPPSRRKTADGDRVDRSEINPERTCRQDNGTVLFLWSFFHMLLH